MEVSDIVAVGRLINGRFVPDAAGYWRVVSSEKGAMISIAPVALNGRPADTPAVVTTDDPNPRLLDLVAAIRRTPSTILERILGLRPITPLDRAIAPEDARSSHNLRYPQTFEASGKIADKSGHVSPS